MPRLPKPGTQVDALVCPKCKKALSEVKAEIPLGVVHCSEVDCPQKPVVQGN